MIAKKNLDSARFDNLKQLEEEAITSLFPKSISTPLDLTAQVVA
ncbi:hypothetical protein [Flavobacterium muglaense]|nr:hypothetical protein [Flavobacterium muglaense]